MSRNVGIPRAPDAEYEVPEPIDILSDPGGRPRKLRYIEATCYGIAAIVVLGIAFAGYLVAAGQTPIWRP